MKAFFLILLLSSSLMGLSQKHKAKIYLNKGKAALNEGNFQYSESCFNHSISIDICSENLYYMAVLKMKTKDSCSGCEYLKKASFYGDTLSKKIFNAECHSSDTINYKCCNYYCVIRKELCSNEEDIRFYKKDTAKNDPNAVLKESISLSEIEYNSEGIIISEYIEDVVYSNCDKMPEYKGGESALMDYLRNNIMYPQLAREESIQGTVFVGFVVRKSGKLTDIRVLKGVGGGLDEEAIRVIKSMPDWIPGNSNGQPVNVMFNIPLRFILQG